MFISAMNAVLKYMDTPWKLFGVIILMIIGLMLYMVYEQRIAIAELILHQRPHLLTTVYNKNAPEILNSADADVIQLYRVNIEDNVMEPVAGFARGGAVWIPNPLSRPLFYENSDPRVVISVVAGTPLCRDINTHTPLLRVEYDLGIRRMCIIGVPPRIGVTIGLIWIGWKTQHNQDVEYYAQIALQSLSKQVTD